MYCHSLIGRHQPKNFHFQLLAAEAGMKFEIGALFYWPPLRSWLEQKITSNLEFNSDTNQLSSLELPMDTQNNCLIRTIELIEADINWLKSIQSMIEKHFSTDLVWMRMIWFETEFYCNCAWLKCVGVNRVRLANLMWIISFGLSIQIIHQISLICIAF